MPPNRNTMDFESVDHEQGQPLVVFHRYANCQQVYPCMCLAGSPCPNQNVHVEHLAWFSCLVAPLFCFFKYSTNANARKHARTIIFMKTCMCGCSVLGPQTWQKMPSACTVEARPSVSNSNFYFGPTQKACYSSDINWAKPISPVSTRSPQVDGPTCHAPVQTA